MRSFLIRTAALCGALTMGVTALSAQSLSQQTSGAARRTPTQIISVNPFLPLFGYFQGEYERRVAENASVGISGAHTRLDDVYTSVDVKVRLYAQERVLEKLGVSAGVGFGRVQSRNNIDCISFPDLRCDTGKKSASAPTFSVEAQYQWLLGANRSTAVAFGGGVKRFFISDSKTEGLERVVPTLRLTIGYAF